MRPKNVVVFTPRYDAGKQEHNGLSIDRLPCYGCAHSAVSVPWPSCPSGERPCGFCVRNPQHVQNLLDDPKWYDGSDPISNPMDCYVTMDMQAQYRIWLEDAEHKGEEAVESLLKLHVRLNPDDEE